MPKKGTLILILLGLVLTVLTYSMPGAPVHQSAYVEPGLVNKDSPTISVIVTGVDSTTVANAVRDIGGHINADLRLIDGVASTIPTAEIQALANTPGIQTITENKFISSAETFPIDSPYMEDGWSTEHRTRQYPEQGVPYYGSLWTPPMPLPNGGVFALGTYGSAILIDADGTVIASFSLPDGDYDTYPVVGSDGVIYVAGANTIHAINPDGTTKWNKTSTLEFQGGLGLYENGNLLYAVTADETIAQFLGLSTVDGEILFTTPSENGENLGDFDTSPMVDAAGFGYIVSDEGNLYKLDVAGDIEWDVVLPTPNEYKFYPQIRPDGSILLASTGGRITVVDPLDGSQVYTFYPETGSIEDFPEISSDGSVYVAIGNTHIYGIDPEGNQKFDFYKSDSDFGYSPQLTTDETQVIVASLGGNIYSLDSTSGTENWSYYTGFFELLLDNPTISPGGNILFGDIWGKYYVLSPDGLPLYHAYYDSFLFSPTISNKGTIFFGNFDLLDWAFEIITLPKPPSEWDIITPDVQPGSDQTNYRVLNPISIDMGADILYENGIDGTDVGIAVVDSGVYFDEDTHTYLGSAVQEHFLGQVDFIVDETECLANSGTWDPIEAYCQTDSYNSSDGFGHGSHVAGIIWNNMTDYNTGVTLGVAPDASILSVRVLGDNGGGSYADVIEGIQYVVENKTTYTPTIRVLNLSLTAVPTSPYFADPLNMAVEEAWAAGIVVLAAAGNVGPQCETITVPGNNPYVITVGALDSHRTPGYWANDNVPTWSATGPTYDGFFKPDILAPGANVVSYMYNGEGDLPYLVQVHPDYAETTSLFRMNGTSMATAAASGVAALMLEHDPSLTPDQVKFRLMYTGQQTVNEYGEVIDNIFQQGAGRIWAPAAVYGDLPVDGMANVGMDILADLAHGWETEEEIVYHYEGPVRKLLSDDGGVYLYYVDAGDETAMALGAVDVATGLWLNADDLDDLAELQPGGELVWTSGQMAWAGGQMAWAGGQMVWAGGQMAWAGGQMAWAGGQMVWAGGQMVWAGTQFIEGEGSTRLPEGLGASTPLDDEGTWLEGNLVWSGSQTDWLGGEMVWEPGLQVWDGGHIDPEETYTDPNPWVNDDGSFDPLQTFIPLLIR